MLDKYRFTSEPAGKTEQQKLSFYGDKLFDFVYTWDIAGDSRQELFEIRKHALDPYTTELSILDKDGERLAFIEGLWHQEQKNTQWFQVLETHNFFNLREHNRISAYNQSQPRIVPRLVANSIVNIVEREKINWFSSATLMEDGILMYRYIATNLHDRVKTEKAFYNPRGGLTAYKVTSL